MTNYLNKLWKTPPEYWWLKIKLIFKEEQPAKTVIKASKWLKINSGVAKGYELFLNPDLFEGWKQMLNGKYDELIFKSIPDYKSKTIWDIGAHFGYSSIVFSCLTGKTGKVLAFEPNKTNFERFKIHQNKNNITNIEIYDIALSDTIGKMNFTYSDDIENSPSTGSHLSTIMPPQSADLYENLGFKEYEVETNTIDNLVYNKKYSTPDILKIDVEGAEYNVLCGAKKTLKENDVILLIEVHNILAMYDTLSFLYKLNYKVKIIDRENSSISRTFIYCQK